MSPLFYIGPIYHLAFTKLDKMIMLDSTDLGVVSDLKVFIFCPKLFSEHRTKNISHQNFATTHLNAIWEVKLHRIIIF